MDGTTGLVHGASVYGWKSDSLYYDPETYRSEIDKALARATPSNMSTQPEWSKRAKTIAKRTSSASQSK